MHDPVDFFHANLVLVLAILSHVADQRPDCREPDLRDLGRSASIVTQKHADRRGRGQSGARVPSCGRRCADAPAAVPFTARGGGEFPPFCARQLSAVADARRTAVYTPFFL
jgi:hypothetical protein